MSLQAERMANAVAGATSRRGFLGKFVKLAGGAAAGMAGVLAASSVRGAPPEKTKLCCEYVTRQLISRFKCVGGHKCPDHWRGAVLWSVGEVPDCTYCGW